MSDAHPDDAHPDDANGALAARWRPVPLHEAASLLDRFGIDGTLTSLTSERDQTFLVTSSDARRFVLKIANPAERADVLRFQQGALEHLAATAPELPVPRVVERSDRADDTTAGFADGTRRVVTLLTFLAGDMLPTVPASAAQAGDVGRVLGLMDAALAGYDAPAPASKLLWDITHTPDLRSLTPHVDAARRPAVLAVLDRFRDEVATPHGSLPRQVIHNDLNPHNIVVDAGNPDRVSGIIDFGDMVKAPRVNDIATALAYVVGRPDGMEAAGAMLRGHAAAITLEDRELAMLPVLVAARVAMTLTITEWRASLFPDARTYILRNHAGALAGMGALAGRGLDDLATLARRARDGD